MEAKLQTCKVSTEPSRPSASLLRYRPWLHRVTNVYLVLAAVIQVIAFPAAALWWNGHLTIQIADRNSHDNSQLIGSGESILARPVCYPPLPTGATLPQPDTTSRAFSAASNRLDRYLKSMMRREDLDSLVVGVVGSSDAVIFEQGYGILRANETGGFQRVPNTNSIYRIASVSKLFAALELMILKQRGVVEWFVSLKRRRASCPTT